MNVPFYDLTEDTQDNEDGDMTSYKQWSWNIDHGRQVLMRVPLQWISFMQDGVCYSTTTVLWGKLTKYKGFNIIYNDIYVCL